MTPLQRLIIAGSLVTALGGLPAKVVAVRHLAAPAIALLTPTAKAQIAKNVIAAKRIDVPVRSLNWGPSCVHASTYHMLQWQGQPQLAAWWKANHRGGESSTSIASDLDAAGINYAMTTNGDAAFLDWAIRTRRAVNVTVQGGAHMVTLVGLDDSMAKILDSNKPTQIKTQSRREFLTEWRSGHGGWAFTTLFDPPAPKPWKILTQRKI